MTNKELAEIIKNLSNEDRKEITEHVKDLWTKEFNTKKQIVSDLIQTSSEAKVKKRVWKPKQGEKYWYVTKRGMVAGDSYYPEQLRQQLRYENTNVYKTKREAY